MSEQLLIVRVRTELYWNILADIYTWLEDEDLASQKDRVTDVRLSETIPTRHDLRVVCKRCGAKLTCVPCIECLFEGGTKKVIRQNYPTDARKGHRRKPPSPTQAEPGSLEKQEVMRRRVAAGFDPHHPLDLFLKREK